MPYYVSGLIHKSDQLLALSPEEAINKRGIDLKVRHEVIHVDRPGKRVTVHELETGNIFEQEYEKLIMASGARAIRPNLPGIELSGIFTLKEFSGWAGSEEIHRT